MDRSHLIAPDQAFLLPVVIDNTRRSYERDSRPLPAMDASTDAAVTLASERRLTLAALVSVAYFTSCGGAFGLEALVGAVGPRWAFALLFLTPLLWSVPIALMAAVRLCRWVQVAPRSRSSGSPDSGSV